MINSSSSRLEKTETPTGKTVSIDFAKEKSIVLERSIIAPGVLSIIMIFIFFISHNSDTFIPGLVFIVCMWGLFLGIYFLSTYPLSIKFIKRSDGSLEVYKRGPFFYHKNIALSSIQNPHIIARPLLLIGAPVLVSTVYKPIIRYKENGIEQDFSLVLGAFGPSLSYLYRLRGVFEKKEMEEIGREINLPVIFE